MRTFTVRYCTAPTYRKVFQTVIRASDKRQALAILRKNEGKKKTLQILAINVSE